MPRGSWAGLTRLVYSPAGMDVLGWFRQRSPLQVIGAAALLAIVGGSLAWLGTARRVALVVDRQPRTIYTHAATVAGALHGAGLSPRPEDYLQPAGETSLSEVDRIIYRRAAPVAVQTAEGVKVVVTAGVLPADILAAVGVRSFPSDRLWADGLPVTDAAQPQPGVPARLRLERGHTFTLSLPDRTILLTSSASTLGEALIEAGYELRDGDGLSPLADTPLRSLSAATYRPARPIQITADGTTIEALAAGPTVGEALAQAGVALAGLDHAVPDAAEPLPADGLLRVIRVREDVRIEQVPVKPPVRQEFSAEYELDTQTLLDPGAYGVRAIRTRLRFEDGAEVARLAEGDWLAIEPQPRVVAFGTKVVLKAINSEYGPLEYYRAIPVYATSYSPCRSGVSSCLYYTSSRKPVQRGVIAVRYAWYLKLGWGVRVYIPGYGIATVEDIGGGIPGVNWVDLGYSDADWEEWGSYTTLYFIAPIPPDVPVIFP